MGSSYRFNPDSLSLDERFGYARQVLPHLAAKLALPPRARVADVGCGTGAFSRFLVGVVGDGGEVVGVDRDPELLDRALKLTSAPAGVSARFERGDALALPFEDGALDAAFSAFLLCVMPEPLRALREMRRVTKPGGLVASLSCFCKSGIFPFFGGLHELDVMDRMDDLIRRFADVRRVRIRNPVLGLPNGRDLDVWGDYRRAGLGDLRIDGFLTVFAPSDARWSDAEAREYVEGRRRVETQMLDGLSDDDRSAMAAGGFTGAEIAELRALIDRKYAWLLEDTARIRRGMEILAEPAVLITGRVPN